MNYPQRATLRVIGVLLFLFAIIFSIIVVPQAQDIRMADNICNLQVDVGFNIELGKYAQEVFDVKEDCTKIHFLRLGVDYSWVVMIVGFALFFTGVWAGLGAKEKKEILG